MRIYIFNSGNTSFYGQNTLFRLLRKLLNVVYRMKFRAALANNDWVVDYGDVIIMADEKGANSMAFRSMVSMAGDKQKQK